VLPAGITLDPLTGVLAGVPVVGRGDGDAAADVAADAVVVAVVDELSGEQHTISTVRFNITPPLEAAGTVLFCEQ
jgi:hypothetical protein